VLIEAKLSDEALSKSLIYFSKSLGDIPMIQLVGKEGVNSRFKNAIVVYAPEYLAGLN
jgi:hypothetical protein